jgi:signal transduction histidine kinase
MSSLNLTDNAAKAELLDLLLGATQDGIVDWNLRTGETAYNPRWKHLLGFDDADMAEFRETPDGWRELIHPNDRAQALRLIDDHIEQGWPLHTTLRMRHRHNGYKHILVRGASRRDAQDCAVRTLLVFSDIDERLREQQSQRLASEAHGIDQPLQLVGDDLPFAKTAIDDLLTLLDKLRNALKNAVYAPPSEIQLVAPCGNEGKISISASADATHALIRVADSGVPEAARGRVLEEFFSTKELGKSPGQGLEVGYDMFVEHQKGSIEFETALGVGTTFIIRLPLQSEPQGSGAVPK